MERLCGLAVDALNVGGLETAIDLPELKVCVDLGVCPRRLVARPTVLFTHPHADHLGGIASHAATRSLFGQAPPTYVVPPAIVEPLGRLFDAWRDLDQSELPLNLVPLSPGESHAIGKRWEVRAFPTIHPVPSQGYAFFEVKKRLRPELEGLPQQELARRGAAGEELSETTRELRAAITGDTRPEVLERETWVRTAPLLITECTFLDERVDRAQAEESGHTHLDEWIERAELFENEVIAFGHFSSRYSAGQVREILERRLPAAMRERVHPLLGRFP